jgi:hypothetical protein
MPDRRDRTAPGRMTMSRVPGGLGLLRYLGPSPLLALVLAAAPPDAAPDPAADGEPAPAPVSDAAPLLAVRLDRLLSFVAWPGSKGVTVPIEVAVWGGCPFAPESLERMTVGGRPIRVRSVDDPREAAACDVLWVGVADGAARIGDLPGVLSVSDRPDFVEQGGLVELGPRRLELNRAAMSRRDVVLDTVLLEVAEVKP